MALVLLEVSHWHMVKGMSPYENILAVQRALLIARQHPAIVSIGDPVRTKANNQVSVELIFEVNFPNAWRAVGKSPSGVQLHEPVRFDFSTDFPLQVPAISLRADFGRNFAHIQPWMVDGRPVPCIVNGELSDFFHQQGILGILNQMMLWFEHAAEGNLITQSQGWEPMRQDGLESYIVADPDTLRSLTDQQGGYKFLGYDYMRYADSTETILLHGQVSNKIIILNSQSGLGIFKEGTRSKGNKKFWQGEGLAIFVWPGKDSHKNPIVCDKYCPQFVSNWEELKSLAADLGCALELNAAICKIAYFARGFKQTAPFPLCIILCGRRPYNLIGINSSIEICPYIIDIQGSTLFKNGNQTAVTPVGLRHKITRALLSRLSGDIVTPKYLPWTLIGAGSLGSKIALHMGRAGRAPNFIIDKAIMNPHNAARHALIPSIGDLQLLWGQAKADLLKEALTGLNQKTQSISKDLLSVIKNKALAQQAFREDSWAIINTTASLTVREILAALSIETLSLRIIDVSLYVQGQIGLICIEGPGRNPNLGDIIAEFYALCQNMKVPIFGSQHLERTVTGEGCGSLTMPMSDGRLSIFSASMSEYLLSLQRTTLHPESGEILIGSLDETGLGLSWQIFKIAAVIKIEVANSPNWQVHIHERAFQKIQAEIAEWPTVETGGIIVGRFSEATQTFNIVDVISAPEDSVRSQYEFTIGTKGLRKILDEYADSVDWSLYTLGTWHSHLSPSAPSQMDLIAAKAIDLARITPSVLLIHTPDGFQAFTSETEG